MGEYKGMRWLKCDLQMQTPADAPHWQGDLIEDNAETAARAFAEACKETGLDVIGITDHNFLSKEFIPLVVEAFRNIEQETGHRTVVFPGFEFEAAGVGRGVHVLCLFKPESDLSALDNILTECGIGYPRVQKGQLVKSDKNLKDILKIVQVQHGGIVIMPHAMSNDGIFDNAAISEWLQQDQFTNPDLLAVEVPKPVRLMNESWQKLFGSGQDCQPDWKRIRPIATVMSSDNKKLVDHNAEGRPTANSIGYRYSWIKMSEPSVESLRQAFLDHESRINLPEDVVGDISPNERQRHPRVESVSIKNAAFLADQEIHFSPNLNCVIGGRGSGKSTLLEYLRILLGKESETDIDRSTRDRINRIRDTLSSGNPEISVAWKNGDGVEDEIIWADGGPKVTSTELADPKTFFSNLPIRVYSQQQLNRITESKVTEGGVRHADRLLELIDGFAEKELESLEDQERNEKIQIRGAFSSLRKARSLELELTRLRQEHQELDRQWRARSEIQADARKHQQLKSEARYLDKTIGLNDGQFNKLVEDTIRLVESHQPYPSTDTPNADWIKQFDEKVEAEKEKLAESIAKSVQDFTDQVERLKAEDPQWEEVSAQLDRADAEFHEACAARGLTPEDVGRLREIDQAREGKQTEINEVGEQIEYAKESAGNPEELIGELHAIWREQFNRRKGAAEKANELAVLNEGHRFVEVSAEYQRNQESFIKLWRSFSPSDGRTRLGRNWDAIGQGVFEIFKGEDAASPWEVLIAALNGEYQQQDVQSNSEELLAYLQEQAEIWETLRCSRVQDVVDMKLFRPDGTEAGSIAEGTLSDGQRNTAALALLLAQEGGPLIIDQPEDELDSNFVFRELIPMLRKVKPSRQLIMATHNANLPVNGDAELIYAFEAKAGRGEMRANGGLDKASITDAVLDIMEGTEEAFRRRREKYHY